MNLKIQTSSGLLTLGKRSPRSIIRCLFNLLIRSIDLVGYNLLIPAILLAHPLLGTILCWGDLRGYNLCWVQSYVLLPGNLLLGAILLAHPVNLLIRSIELILLGTFSERLKTSKARESETAARYQPPTCMIPSVVSCRFESPRFTLSLTFTSSVFISPTNARCYVRSKTGENRKNTWRAVIKVQTNKISIETYFIDVYIEAMNQLQWDRRSF